MDKQQLPPPAELVPYYNCGVKPKKAGPDLWTFACKVCGAAWTLPMSETPHVGNVLELLNHAHSHEKTTE